MKNFHLQLPKKLFLKHYVVEGNTEAVAQKCFMKISVLKNVWKIHTFNVCGKTGSFVEPEAERKATGFPCELSENIQSYLNLIKSLSKERRFR